MKRLIGLPILVMALCGLSHPQSSRAGDPTQDKKEPKVITTKSGLKYIDEKEGTGAEAKAGDTVEVHYTGTFKDGKKFDSSKDRGRPFSFKLGGRQVIAGWDEGVAGMKVGGKRKLGSAPLK